MSHGAKLCDSSIPSGALGGGRGEAEEKRSLEEGPGSEIGPVTEWEGMWRNRQGLKLSKGERSLRGRNEIWGKWLREKGKRLLKKMDAPFRHAGGRSA